MRILVTNDDGINAPGLVIAESIANEIAGDEILLLINRASKVCANSGARVVE